MTAQAVQFSRYSKPPVCSPSKRKACRLWLNEEQYAGLTELIAEPDLNLGIRLRRYRKQYIDLIKTRIARCDPGVLHRLGTGCYAIQYQLEIGQLFQWRGLFEQLTVYRVRHGLAKASRVEDHDLARFCRRGSGDHRSVRVKGDGIVRVQLEQRWRRGGEFDGNGRSAMTIQHYLHAGRPRQEIGRYQEVNLARRHVVHAGREVSHKHANARSRKHGGKHASLNVTRGYRRGDVR